MFSFEDRLEIRINRFWCVSPTVTSTAPVHPGNCSRFLLNRS